MSGFELAARLTEAVTWPVVALLIAVVLRHPIRQLLTHRPPNKVKAGPFEVEWDKVLAETETEVDAVSVTAAPTSGAVREELAAEAEAAPVVAVREAFVTLEDALRKLLAAASVPDQQVSSAGAVGLARIALREGLITPETVRAVEGVSVMRNLATHGSARDITSEQAREYLALVDAVLYVLNTPR